MGRRAWRFPHDLVMVYPMRIIVLLALFCAAGPLPLLAAEVCPVRPGQPLRFDDVFDKAPEDMALLRPGQEYRRSGGRALGHICDAGRNVTIRCKYADGQGLDLKLPSRAERCSYRLGAKRALKLDCA